MVLHCILWYCIVSYGNALVLHGISLYCMVLQDVALYGTVLHCIVLNLMVLHCTIVGFGARAVSRKTPIYFILSTSWRDFKDMRLCAVVLSTFLQPQGQKDSSFNRREKESP